MADHNLKKFKHSINEEPNFLTETEHMDVVDPFRVTPLMPKNTTYLPIIQEIKPDTDKVFIEALEKVKKELNSQEDQRDVKQKFLDRTSSPKGINQRTSRYTDIEELAKKVDRKPNPSIQEVKPNEEDIFLREVNKMLDQHNFKSSRKSKLQETLNTKISEDKVDSLVNNYKDINAQTRNKRVDTLRDLKEINNNYQEYDFTKLEEKLKSMSKIWMRKDWEKQADLTNYASLLSAANRRERGRSKKNTQIAQEIVKLYTYIQEKKEEEIKSLDKEITSINSTPQANLSVIEQNPPGENIIMFPETRPFEENLYDKLGTISEKILDEMISQANTPQNEDFPSEETGEISVGISFPIRSEVSKQEGKILDLKPQKYKLISKNSERYEISDDVNFENNSTTNPDNTLQTPIPKEEIDEMIRNCGGTQNEKGLEEKLETTTTKDRVSMKLMLQESSKRDLIEAFLNYGYDINQRDIPERYEGVKLEGGTFLLAEKKEIGVTYKKITSKDQLEKILLNTVQEEVVLPKSNTPMTREEFKNKYDEELKVCGSNFNKRRPNSISTEVRTGYYVISKFVEEKGSFRDILNFFVGKKEKMLHTIGEKVMQESMETGRDINDYSATQLISEYFLSQRVKPLNKNIYKLLLKGSRSVSEETFDFTKSLFLGPSGFSIAYDTLNNKNNK